MIKTNIPNPFRYKIKFPYSHINMTYSPYSQMKMDDLFELNVNYCSNSIFIEVLYKKENTGEHVDINND
jgi:hypothetical protein